MRLDIQSQVKKFVEATNAGDVSAVMEMYSRAAGVTDIGDGEIHRGWDAIRTETDLLTGKQGSFRFSLGAIDVFGLGPTGALAVAPYVVQVATANGNAEVNGALTIVFEKAATGWRIIHSHMSTKPPSGD